jgi:Skp family chaperone for outer membrane proteins
MKKITLKSYVIILTTVVVVMASYLIMTLTKTDITSSKVAVVNAVKIFDSVPQGKSSLDLVEKDFQPKAEQLYAEFEVLQDNQKSIGVEDNNAKDKGKKDIENLIGQYKQLQATAQEKNQSIEETFTEQLNSATKKIAKKHGYDLVVNKSTAIYVNDKDNITGEIMTLMQSQK